MAISLAKRCISTSLCKASEPCISFSNDFLSAGPSWPDRNCWIRSYLSTSVSISQQVFKFLILAHQLDKALFALVVLRFGGILVGESHFLAQLFHAMVKIDDQGQQLFATVAYFPKCFLHDH